MLIMDQGRAHSILAMFKIPEGVCPLIIIQPSMLRNLVLLPPSYKLYDGVREMSCLAEVCTVWELFL